ncbi:thermonuclease family protein [Jiella sonneratiae]|uniref:Thermonuclease family protein n=1 Tax=Jiella sonneratiae TaxID=2816856 RepID=A0ABS3J1J2_9HYPH|nr:thermonuclease family protein [Jiella sonneratiae]MBO0903544.1 thermonuclease family protein [Jiella sonneratiae]
MAQSTRTSWRSASTRRRRRGAWRLPFKLAREALLVAAVFLAAVAVGRLHENGVADEFFAAVEGGLSATASGVGGHGAAAASVHGALPVCGRGERRTCLVDGDTGWADGRKWRLARIDTPEVFSPACPAERRIGEQATRRLQALLSQGYRLAADGTDRYGRDLVTITLADGRDAGRVLMGEGLAQPWPNRSNPWCG